MSNRHDFWAMYDQDIFVDRVLHHPKMTMGCIRVWGVFMRVLGRDGKVDLRFNDMARQAGVSLRSVKQIVLDIERRGWIVRVTSPRCYIKYMVNPELIWKGKIDERAGLEREYQDIKKKREQEIKKERKKPVDLIEKPIIIDGISPGETQCA